MAALSQKTTAQQAITAPKQQRKGNYTPKRTKQAGAANNWLLPLFFETLLETLWNFCDYSEW